MTWHRHKQHASHYWESKRSLILHKKFSCWEKYCQMEQKTWLECMIVSDKPEFNCFEYKIWKCPCFSVLICWKFKYKQSLKPNDLEGIQLYSPSPAILYVALSRRVNTAAAVIVHIQIQFSNVIFQTWSSPLFQNISDFELEIGQCHSVWQLLNQNAELKSCNVTHSGL